MYGLNPWPLGLHWATVIYCTLPCIVLDCKEVKNDWPHLCALEACYTSMHNPTIIRGCPLAPIALGGVLCYIATSSLEVTETRYRVHSNLYLCKPQKSKVKNDKNNCIHTNHYCCYNVSQYLGFSRFEYLYLREALFFPPSSCYL